MTPAPGSPTITDLATFRVEAPSGWVNPEVFTLSRFPTTFSGSAATHEVVGELLGQAAVVRFTPVGFGWDFGDGQTAEVAAAGGAGSVVHEYRKHGRYPAAVFALFTAEYRWGTDIGWTPIPGHVFSSASLGEVWVREAKTVLTRGTCIEFPQDPGCPDAPPVEEWWPEDD